MGFKYNVSPRESYFIAGGVDDTTRFSAAQTALLSGGGNGTLIAVPGPSGENVVLNEGDWLPGITLESRGGVVFKQKSGARWCLRSTDTIGSPATSRLFHYRNTGHQLNIDMNGQVGCGLFGELLWSSKLDVNVYNPAGSGEWTYDDWSGSGTLPYPTTGVFFKGTENVWGCYYNDLHIYGTGAGMPAFTAFKGAWSPTTTYAQYDCVYDPYTGDFYVSQAGSNVNTRPFGNPSSWTQGTWHTSQTYTAGQPTITWNGTRYELWISQTTQSGHNPTTDVGTNWKRATNGVTFSGTDVLATQKANDARVNGRVSGWGQGVAIWNGADITVESGMEVSSNIAGVWANSSGARVVKPYMENCAIGVFFGKNCVYGRLIDESSSAQTEAPIIIAGSQTYAEMRRGRVGADRYQSGQIAPNQTVPIINFRLMKAVDTVSTPTYNLVGNQKVVEDGTYIRIYSSTANRTYKDSSSNVALTSCSLIGSALTQTGANFIGREGQWVQVNNAGTLDYAGVRQPLTTYIFSVTDATHCTLATLATSDVTSGGTGSYGSGFVLAGSKDFTPAVGDFIEFVSDGGMWYEVGRSIRADGQTAKRVESLPDSATITPNFTLADEGLITALSQASTIANPTGTGTPKDGQTYLLRMKSSISRAVGWGTAWRGSSDLALPTANTGGGSTDYYFFIYNAADSKWDFLGQNRGF